jgi:hypothetical protein
MKQRMKEKAERELCLIADDFGKVDVHETGNQNSSRRGNGAQANEASILAAKVGPYEQVDTQRYGSKFAPP